MSANILKSRCGLSLSSGTTVCTDEHVPCIGKDVLSLLDLSRYEGQALRESHLQGCIAEEECNRARTEYYRRESSAFPKDLDIP